ATTCGSRPALVVHPRAPMSVEPTESLAKLLELPEGRPVLGAAALARSALAKGGVKHAVGAEGSAPALVARAVAATSARPVLYITPDLDAARRAADDLAFLSKDAAGVSSEST